MSTLQERLAKHSILLQDESVGSMVKALDDCLHLLQNASGSEPESDSYGISSQNLMWSKNDGFQDGTDPQIERLQQQIDRYNMDIAALKESKLLDDLISRERILANILHDKDDFGNRSLEEIVDCLNRIKEKTTLR
eukprot:GILK01010726.1.p1 GENE.GILK01010726.1~~GILK01010726.1.p1  ORF type:complete len:148 (-),score=30.43 GILK01010726.1:239-646(-)